MNDQPGQPSHASCQFPLAGYGNRFVATDRCHDPFITILKGQTLFSRQVPFKSFPQKNAPAVARPVQAREGVRRFPFQNEPDRQQQTHGRTRER